MFFFVSEFFYTMLMHYTLKLIIIQCLFYCVCSHGCFFYCECVV